MSEVTRQPDDVDGTIARRERIRKLEVGVTRPLVHYRLERWKPGDSDADAIAQAITRCSWWKPTSSSSIPDDDPHHMVMLPHARAIYDGLMSARPARRNGGEEMLPGPFNPNGQGVPFAKKVATELFYLLQSIGGMPTWGDFGQIGRAEPWHRVGSGATAPLDRTSLSFYDRFIQVDWPHSGDVSKPDQGWGDYAQWFEEQIFEPVQPYPEGAFVVHHDSHNTFYAVAATSEEQGTCVFNGQTNQWEFQPDGNGPLSIESLDCWPTVKDASRDLVFFEGSPGNPAHERAGGVELLNTVVSYTTYRACNDMAGCPTPAPAHIGDSQTEHWILKADRVMVRTAPFDYRPGGEGGAEEVGGPPDPTWGQNYVHTAIRDDFSSSRTYPGYAAAKTQIMDALPSYPNLHSFILGIPAPRKGPDQRGWEALPLVTPWLAASGRGIEVRKRNGIIYLRGSVKSLWPVRTWSTNPVFTMLETDILAPIPPQSSGWAASFEFVGARQGSRPALLRATRNAGRWSFHFPMGISQEGYYTKDEPISLDGVKWPANIVE